MNAIGYAIFLVFLGCVGIGVFVGLCALLFAKEYETTGSTERITPPDPQATTLDDSRSWAQLVPNGRETFFPTAPAGSVYEITITGIVRGADAASDAFYFTDHAGNFSHATSWLLVNRLELRYHAYELSYSDRCEHRYTLRVDDPGSRVTLALRPWTSWRGALFAEVTVLPAGTAAIRKSREEVQKRSRAELEAAKDAERFSEQIQKLSTRSQLYRNWGDQEFRQKFAKVHHEDLLREQHEIRKEALAFLEQHDIVRYLRRHHPEIVDRFTGRLETLLIAERVSLDKRLAAEMPAPAAPRKRLSADEVRTIKIHRQQVGDQDKVALKLDRIQTRLQIRERLEQLPLDLDEREMIERELIEQIDEGDNPNGTTL